MEASTEITNVGKGEDKIAMATQMECDLGEFIRQQNPYTQNMQLPPDWKAKSETDTSVNYWYFKGAPLRVKKAIRVLYTYVENGKTETEHLLIGYEGAGGG